MRKGQSLIEVLVAVGIATILGVALVSTTVLTQKASKSSQNTAYATKLAQELVEELRIFRDQSRDKLNAFPFGLSAGEYRCYVVTNTKNGDGSLFLTPNGSGNLQWTFTPIGGGWTACPATTSLPSTAGIETLPSDNVTFYRYFQVKKDPAAGGFTGLTFTVNVSWLESSGWRTVAYDSYITKWVGP